MADDFHGPVAHNIDDMEWDNEMAFGYDGWEDDEEELRGSPCNDCGPWCPDWGGDGLCMIAIRSMAEEYEPAPFFQIVKERLHSFLLMARDRILPARCSDCGKFYIFSKNDHGDCLPF